MVPSGKFVSTCIVHPGSEDSAHFSIGDGYVELITTARTSESYDFENVFPPKTTQEKVFQEVAKAPVLDALDSFVSTVFLAFGPTGSGKTFAVTGGAKRFADRGLIPRSISALFEALAARVDKDDFEVAVSFYEIYKDSVVDLLSERRKKVPVQQTEGHAPVLQGLLRQTAATESDAYHLLFQGDSNRHFERFPANPETSRGHVFYVLHLTHLPTGREATLSFVDLAAVISARTHATTSIERSLAAFKAAVSSICSGEKPVFDGQILTQLLQPLVQPDLETIPPNLSIICPVRYTKQTADEVYESLDFARQLREAVLVGDSGRRMEDGNTESMQSQFLSQVYAAPELGGSPIPVLEPGASPVPVPSFFQAPEVSVSQSPPRAEVIFDAQGVPAVASQMLPAANVSSMSPLRSTGERQQILAQEAAHFTPDLYAYQAPVAQIAQAGDVRVSSPGNAFGQAGDVRVSSPARTLQSALQVLSPARAAEQGLAGLPLQPVTVAQAAVPSVPTWSPPQYRADGRNADDLVVDARTSSDVTLPPVPLYQATADSPGTGSVTLAQGGSAMQFMAFDLESASAAMVSTTLANPAPQVEAFIEQPFAVTASSTAGAVAEESRVVMRAPYLFPRSSSQPRYPEDVSSAPQVSSAPLAQRTQETTIPRLPLTTLSSAGVVANPGSHVAVSGTYPGTLCVPQSQSVPSSAAQVVSIETAPNAPVAPSNVQPVVDPKQPSWTGAMPAALNSLSISSAPPPIPVSGTDVASIWTPGASHAAPPRARTPNSAAVASGRNASSGGSASVARGRSPEGGSFAVQSASRTVTGLLPSRSGISVLEQGAAQAARIASGPPRSPSYVGPSRSPGPRSPVLRAARVSTSPCGSRANSGSPLPQRVPAQGELTSSARGNVYAPGRVGLAVAADGGLPRSLSPMPGQQASLPNPLLLPTSVGAMWSQGADGVCVAAVGSAVPLQRTRAAPSRSVSPMPDGRQRGESGRYVPGEAVSLLGSTPSYREPRLSAPARSLTPQRGETALYSPQPRVSRASYAHRSANDSQLRSSLNGSISVDVEATGIGSAAYSSAAAGNSSFVLTKTPSLSGSGKGTDASVPTLKLPGAAAADGGETQLRVAVSPQPSRPMSPMPSAQGSSHLCGVARRLPTVVYA